MTVTRRSRSVPNDRELRLWRVGRALTLSFFVAVLVAGCVFMGLVYLLDFQEIDNTKKLDAKTLFDLVKLSFGVVAGAGALVALVVAYRRQRVDEAGAHRDATRLHTERFSQAVDKLGSDSPAVRLGGVHALAGLADDAPDDDLRQTCIDVLCAYLHLPFSPDPGDEPAWPDGSPLPEEHRDAHQEKRNRYRALREVRHTILRLIGDHYRIPTGTHRSWQGCNLDLTGVTIDGRMRFKGASFSSGTVNFDGAEFCGGSVDFAGAAFSAGTVSFVGAVFSGGGVYFGGARFSDGAVSFDHAEFSGGAVFFVGAEFSGGAVNFDSAQFSGGDVNFDDAEFSGGDVNFDDAEFSGGDVRFTRTAFSGGTVDFAGAAFSGGDVSFDSAEFHGSHLRIDATTGPAPGGLLEAVGTPVPAEIRLRPDWLPPTPQE
ncbi:pentapeptide repeat-containing protein [Streptomyces sp. NPDC057287]|uniref:pentapeptide repeat-containing protein n=1 Tax=Streptomyces sp. NPDC057287 TaxID=3346086 RepID=UPI0036458E49